MLVTYAAEHRKHAPEHYILRGVSVPARESPDRAETLLAGVRDDGHHVAAPRDFGLAPLRAVHSDDYLRFLESAFAQWQALSAGIPRGRMVVGNSYAVRPLAARPQGFEGQVGYYLSGASVPLDAGSWDAMRMSANCALEAADAVAQGASEAYALCRPPGHHAYADLAGGFCYLNNAAIAAQYLTSLGRVAILDVDVHHGNGTQGIFYERGDVLFVSLHADPNFAYPWYAGYEAERGQGEGAGTTLNLPLPLGSGDAAFLAALERGLDAVSRFAPAALVVSLGLDAYKDDPSALLAVTTAGFGAIGGRIGALALPTVIVQEGGYAVDALAANLTSFLRGFTAGRP